MHDVLEPDEPITGSTKEEVSRNVVIMGVVSFFTDVASEMIYPILPIFITTTLGAPVAVVGLIEGAASAILNILKVISGWISDKLKKRKIIVIVGYSTSALSKLVIAMAGGWPMVMAGKFFDRVGKGTRTSPRDALIAESTPKYMRGRAFGLHRGIDNAGAIIGPLLAVYLLYSLQASIRSIFYIAFIPGLIGVVCLILFVKEVHTKSTRSTATLNFKIADLSRSFKLFLMISTIFALGNSADAFMILKAKAIGVPISLILVLYALLNLAHSAFSLPAGIVSDKIGPKKVVLAGFLLFALTYMLLGVTTSAALLWLLFPLLGLHRGLTEGVSIAYISNMVTQEHTATAIGFYQATTGMATLMASIAAGIMWDVWGSAVPFLFGGVMAIVASIAFIVLEQRIGHEPLFIK